MNEKETNENINLTWLDKIIKEYCQHFIDKIDDKAKIGDLFKMFELRRKLSPENSEQKKFWKMINKIRKDNLQNSDESKKNTNRESNEK